MNLRLTLLFVALTVPVLAGGAVAQSTSGLEVAKEGAPVGLNDLVQLPQATAGQTQLAFEFSVFNGGSADVQLSQKQGAVISGDSANAFSVVMQPVPLLHPGDRVWFRILYAPKTPGASFAKVKLVGDDPSKPLYWFFVQALAIPPSR